MQLTCQAYMVNAITVLPAILGGGVRARARLRCGSMTARDVTNQISPRAPFSIN